LYYSPKQIESIKQSGVAGKIGDNEDTPIFKSVDKQISNLYSLRRNIENYGAITPKKILSKSDQLYSSPGGKYVNERIRELRAQGIEAKPVKSGDGYALEVQNFDQLKLSDNEKEVKIEEIRKEIETLQKSFIKQYKQVTKEND